MLRSRSYISVTRPESGAVTIFPQESILHEYSAARSFPRRAKLLIMCCGGSLRRTDCRFCKNGTKTFKRNCVSHGAQLLPSFYSETAERRTFYQPYYPIQFSEECVPFARSCEVPNAALPLLESILSLYRGKCTVPVLSCRGLRAGTFLPAFPLSGLPLFFINTNFFIAGGRAIRQAVVVKGVWVRLLGYVPLFSEYSNYLFDRCSITRSGCGAKRLFPAFINFFLFSGGRSRQAVARVTSCARWTESPELRPPFLWLYEQFFHNNIRLDGPNLGAFTGTFRTFGLFLCLPL